MTFWQGTDEYNFHLIQDIKYHWHIHRPFRTHPIITSQKVIFFILFYFFNHVLALSIITHAINRFLFFSFRIILMWFIHSVKYRNSLLFLISLWYALINFIEAKFTNNKMHPFLNIWFEFWLTHVHSCDYPPTWHRTLPSPQKIFSCYFTVWTTFPLHSMPHSSYFLPSFLFWNITLSIFLPGFQTFQSFSIVLKIKGIFWMTFYVLPKLMSAYCHLVLYLLTLLSFHIGQFIIPCMCKIFTSCLCMWMKFFKPRVNFLSLPVPNHSAG